MSDWKIDHKELRKQLDEAEKISDSLIRRTIGNRLMLQLKEKTPFSETELRKLIRLALANYERNNELPLHKINLLDEEDRQECLSRINTQFHIIFDEILKDSPSRAKKSIGSIFETFFS